MTFPFPVSGHEPLSRTHIQREKATQVKSLSGADRKAFGAHMQAMDRWAVSLIRNHIHYFLRFSRHWCHHYQVIIRQQLT